MASGQWTYEALNYFFYFSDVLTVQHSWNLYWIWGINLRCFTFLQWPRVNLKVCSVWVHVTFVLGYGAFGQGQVFRSAKCSFRFLNMKQPEFHICRETGAPTGNNNWICKYLHVATGHSCNCVPCFGHLNKISFPGLHGVFWSLMPFADLSLFGKCFIANTWCLHAPVCIYFFSRSSNNFSEKWNASNIFQTATFSSHWKILLLREFFGDITENFLFLLFTWKRSIGQHLKSIIKEREQASLLNTFWGKECLLISKWLFISNWNESLLKFKSHRRREWSLNIW